jgi:hypothetical protein
MKAEQFKKITAKQLSYCLEVLGLKADEYATDDDRLENFKRAAILQGISPVQALGGMMAKHTVALYDFISKDEKSYKRWEEKITDTINYCLLLEALICEREDIF